MIMVKDSAVSIKRFLGFCFLDAFLASMVMRLVIAFIFHRGRMSCSAASAMFASEPIHRSQMTRFLGRPRWKKTDINNPARKRLLMLESRRGAFILIFDATLVGQSGRYTENTYSTGNRKRRSRKKGVRYGKYKHASRSCHQFGFCLLITPSGYRIPYQIPHYTKAYAEQHGLPQLTPTETAAILIEQIELPKGAEVYVMGDTAYDAEIIHEACSKKNYFWITPMNVSRVFEGNKGNRPQVRTRLKDWKHLSLKTIKIHASKSEYASYRRLSRWRIGSKVKPRTYYAFLETRSVHSVGKVNLVYSTTKPVLKKATPDEVKILMTNAMHLSLSRVIDLYSLRWQIELFFKELKSRLGFDQYRFKKFSEVEGWVTLALTTVLYLETLRAEQMSRKDLTKKQREWWSMQRLHGLCEATIQMTELEELKYISTRIKTPGGITKLKRLLLNSSPKEYQHAA
jgi:IS4 transposase